MNRLAASKSTPRGGAVLCLVVVIAVWASFRMTTWTPPFAPASLSVLPLGDAPLLLRSPEQVPTSPARDEPAIPREAEPGLSAPVAPAPVVPAPPPWQPIPTPDQTVPASLYETSHMQQGRGSNGANRAFAGAGRMVEHIQLLQAGYRASAPYEAAVPPLFAPTATAHASGDAAPAPNAARPMGEESTLARWSMDAWALWREDTTTPILSGRPSYGRSQVGAVMRYRLSPSSGHAPQVHLRASHALEGQLEREVAFGASARPLASVPIRLAVEGRVSETSRGTEVRGAAYAVTEIAPIDLPAGMTAEVYAQAGYVSGEFATPFVDGQARITRRIVGADDFRLEAGGGAWGGAQEDAQRLDIGPSASLNFRIGPARGRVSADYRFRVAGEAEPASGPALTLSAGF